MRTRQPGRAEPRWLPLEQVAPIPPRAPRAGGADQLDPARAEVAATALVTLPPASPGAPRSLRHTSAVTWRGSTVALLALVMALAGIAGLAQLRAQGSAARQVEPSLAVPGTGLVVDKPGGWTEGPIESAPSVLTDLVDAGAGGGNGLFFTAAGGRALFVVDTPNSADLDEVPPVPERIGAAVVSEQMPFTHELGPARRVFANADEPGARFGLVADYVLTEGRIVVVGAFAEGTLQTDTITASEALLESLRSR